jgi:hypothetical protein
MPATPAPKPKKPRIRKSRYGNDIPYMFYMSDGDMAALRRAAKKKHQGVAEVLRQLIREHVK